MHWYVIKTKAGQERQAELHLRQLNVEAFLPLMKQGKIVQRIRTTRIAPLFPGYLFARFDVMKHYRAVIYAKGVQRIVEFDQKPAEVDDSLINSIKVQLKDGYLTLKPRTIATGQVVKISDGPLRGLETIFVREMSDQRRALLLLRTIGLQATVIVDVDQVSFSKAM